MNQANSEFQKRRADNLIWNSAKDYSFAPDFKAYDRSGEADIYWNIIFGSARRHYEYEKLEKLFAMLDRYRNSAEYEALFWNALEPLLFRKELAVRPVLEAIRPEPAETELVFRDDMSTDEIVAEARRFFYERYGLYGDGKIRLKYRLPRLRRMSVDSFLQRGPIVIHEKDLGFRVVDQVVDAVRLEFVQDRHRNCPVSEGGQETHAPVGLVARTDGDFVSLLQTALLEGDVQFGNPPGNVPVGKRHALIVGERSTVPVLPEAVLKKLVDRFEVHKI